MLGEGDLGTPHERSEGKSCDLQSHSEPGYQHVKQFSQTTLPFKSKNIRGLYLSALL